jgi:hypothetical protein
MKMLIVAAIRCSLMFLVPRVTHAISAQWDLDPISGDWNTAANWTPMGVPNGPADIATLQRDDFKEPPRRQDSDNISRKTRSPS